jgi:hypothetical protein
VSGEFPDPEIPQDPGIPSTGGGDAPTPDEQDESGAQRERPDDPDEEGHMTPPGEG